MNLKETADRGVRFWMPCVESYPGIPEQKGSGPFPKTPKGHVRKMGFANLIDPRNQKPVEIYGEAFFDNAELIEQLVKHGGGRLLFNSAEIVSKGYLSAEKMSELGYPVPKDTKQGKAPVGANEPLPEPLPDFSTMKKEELREWADAHEIFLDAKMTQNSMVKKIVAELNPKAAKK